MTPLILRNSQPSEPLPAGAYVGPPLGAAATSARLVRGADLIREEWLQVQSGASRSKLDKLLLLWLDLMQDYYHAGGSGCAMSLADRRCEESWDPVPLCWACAGGTGYPPKTTRKEEASDGIDSQRDSNSRGSPSGLGNHGGEAAVVRAKVAVRKEGASDGSDMVSTNIGDNKMHDGDTGGVAARGVVEEVEEPPEVREEKLPVHTDSALPGRVSPVRCNREGCEHTSMHIHLSGIGACRRLRAYDLLGMKLSVPRQDHWDRAAALGTFGETLVVEYLKSKGYELWNTLEDQQALEFEENGVLYVGHPDGDIRHGGDPSEVHNLEIKCLSDSRWRMFQDQGVELAFPEYAAQAVSYLRWKEQQTTHFAVMSRDSGRIFEVEYTPKDVWAAWRALAARIEEVAPIIMAGELPEPDFGGEQFECVVCAYGKACPKRKAALESRKSQRAVK